MFKATFREEETPVSQLPATVLPPAVREDGLPTRVLPLVGAA
jgi:hypothetical protein